MAFTVKPFHITEEFMKHWETPEWEDLSDDRVEVFIYKLLVNLLDIHAACEVRYPYCQRTMGNYIQCTSVRSISHPDRCQLRLAKPFEFEMSLRLLRKTKILTIFYENANALNVLSVLVVCELPSLLFPRFPSASDVVAEDVSLRLIPRYPGRKKGAGVPPGRADRGSPSNWSAVNTALFPVTALTGTSRPG
ncbi:hypothetical protein J6590_029605 [Homalodisca vitripennis]|nr:hypothetical protein J6590_029605 [Homalodisca vitripennis]